MEFSSIIFLLYFLPVFLLLYQFVGRAFKNYVLLGASVLFYAWGAPLFVFVILTSTIIDFYLVNLLHKTANQKHRKLYLILSLFMNLGLLVYFKYANFFVDNFNHALHLIGIQSVSWTAVVLPIGISFYTFQTITYAIDIYRREQAPTKKLSSYLVYIMSFPQMIAGPIVKYGDVANQLENRTESIDQKLSGFYRFSIGLAKKVLLSNVMSIQADSIINSDLSNLSTANAWLGIFAYTMQIYFDFSGYSDMAIGLGKMMGFKFPENFNSPYISKNISEFWRRWHMTLGTFMKEYLYIPLGGNRVSSNSRLYFNLALVFLLSGLWHGASWNFVIWGAFHGMFLILDRILLINVLNRIGTIPSILFTFFIVMIGWTIFRIEDLDRMEIYFWKLFSFSGSFSFNDIPEFTLIAIFSVLFSISSKFSLGKKLEDFVFVKEQYSIPEHIGFTLCAIIFMILSISSIASSGANPFIYFRF